MSEIPLKTLDPEQSVASLSAESTDHLAPLRPPATETELSSAMYEKRRSRMEDTGDFQVLSSLASFQLLLPSHEWSDKSLGFRRLVLRITTLVVLLGIMAGMLVVAGIYGSLPPSVLGTLPLDLPMYEVRLDGCYLDMYVNQTPQSGPPEDEVQVAVYTQITSGIDIFIDPRRGVVQVWDSRDMGLRYGGNEWSRCSCLQGPCCRP